MNKIQNPAWTFLLLSFSLLGCTVGPMYVEPEVEVPYEWQNKYAQEFDQKPIDSFRWWECLNDPLLNCLIEHLSAQNLDLNIAITRILEARLSQRGAEGNIYPHLDGSITYSYLNYNQNTLNQAFGCGRKKGCHQRHLNLFEAGFDADWELDLFGMYSHQNKALAAMTEASQEDFSNAWVTLSAEVARNYVELRGLQQRLEIINHEIDVQKDHQKLTDSLFIGGFIGTIEQTQTNEELSTLMAQKPEIEFLIQKNIHHLSILLGNLPSNLTCQLNVPQPVPQLPCQKPIGIPSELLRRRPDIRKAERNLAAATENVGAAIAALFPRISLTGFIGDLATFCSGNSWTGFAGPQLLMPIFNSRLLKEDVCLNKIKAEQALLVYQKTVLEAFEETENAIASFYSQRQKNEELKSIRESRQYVYIQTFQLYENGLKNYLDVQIAYQKLLAADSTFLQSQIDLLVNYISLYKALGGGWETLSPFPH